MCRIEVSDGEDASIDVPMLGGFGPVDGNASYGSLTISGPGTVRLNATGMKSYLLSSFVAENGASVYLPQNGDLSNAAAYELGTAVVSNSATLHLPVRHDGLKNGGSNYVLFNGGLFGDGTGDFYGTSAAMRARSRFTISTTPPWRTAPYVCARRRRRPREAS